MKKNLRNAIATLALSALTVAAFAQNGPPLGGPPDGPEGGPMQGPGQRPGPPRDGMRWLLNPKVVAELKLSGDQIAKIRTLMPPRPEGQGGRPGEPGRGGPDRNGGPGGPGGQGGPPPAGEPGGAGQPPRDGNRPPRPEDRLKTILSADQFARFSQLRLQREGVRAIGHPEVAKELGLTEDQREEMRPTPPEDGQRPDRQQEEARILNLLTKAQREKWRAMLGRPFDFGKEGPKNGDGPPPPPQDQAPQA